MFEKRVYKKDSRGKIRTTIFTVVGNKVTMQSGLLEGKLKETSFVCKGKNKGKTNETSDEQQALLEAKSRIAKKLDEGYFYSVEGAENNEVVLPMLAQTFSDNLVDFSETITISPKFDGMRALYSQEGFKSRKGKVITTMPHIMLKKLPREVFLDGELYAHGEDFQTNMSLIKRNQKDSVKVKFYVYDIYIKGSTKGHLERLELVKEFLKGSENCEFVLPKKLKDREELLTEHYKNIENGFEGSMIRVDKVPYEVNKRSKSLLKFKDFMDKVYKVVDIVPNNYSPLQGTVVCDENGHTFKCGMKMNYLDRIDLLLHKDKYIGKSVEIRFFEKSSNGVPRFPICLGFRNDV